MDRKYIEENLSAYLDGELQPRQMREFEHDIQSYPDLFAELQTLQRLNKLALDSKVPMPNDAYFDGLAGRIDSQIKRESPRDRSRIVEFLFERRRSVAIISSAAAVLLIALIGMNMFGPNAKRYPNELRTIEVKPAISTSPKTDSATMWPKHEQQIVPPPVVEDEADSEVARSSETVDTSATKQMKSLVQNSRDSLLSASPAATTAIEPATRDRSAASRIAVTERPIQMVRPDTGKRDALQSISLPKSKSGNAREMSLESTNAALIDIPLRVVDSITIRTEAIIPGPFEERSFADAAPGRGEIRPDIERFHAGTERSWSTYVRIFDELNQRVYSSWSLTAPASSRDSLQSWVDSLRILGPAQWYAEQSFRALRVSPPNWDEYQRCRAYIDYYLAEYQVPDSSVWNRRIDIVNEVLERQLGKTNQNRK